MNKDEVMGFSACASDVNYVVRGVLKDLREENYGSAKEKAPRVEGLLTQLMEIEQREWDRAYD